MLGLPRGAEWIIILVIVVLLFGPGRIGKIAGNLDGVLRTSVKDWGPRKSRIKSL